MALVAVGEEALVVAVALAEVTPLVVVVLLGPEVEVLALQNLANFHKDTANMGHYRTPVAFHLEANRTPVPERRTPQASN